MWKKVDERIVTHIENGVKTKHRSIFVIVGYKSSYRVVNLHYILSKVSDKASPSVLWCYEKKLELSRRKEKARKKLTKKLHSGLPDPQTVDPFLLFLESGAVTYSLYKDSENILGNTYGMCVLQDFEALTPNLLARTVETVEGGGLVVLLLPSLTSITSLYTMVMNVHKRYRPESQSQASGRFNERFLRSLVTCEACIVLDDEFNILPISSHIRSISAVPVKEDPNGLSESDIDLKKLKEQLSDDFPVGHLIKQCRTLDQGKAVIKFLDAILDETLRGTVTTVALSTSARGRGKSAALGLAIAGAIGIGFSNICLTAPSPENLKILFDFILRGLTSLEYKEYMDYDIKRTEEAIIKVTIRKKHWQTIQYIQPHERDKLSSQVDLLVIDEAAAIPLPIVKSLLGPYLVFLSSTVSGYEGTGRSLSLKLIQELDGQSRGAQSVSGYLFKKVELSEPIRYAPGDPVESWLNSVLCLDVAIPNISRLPSPDECDLYYVNRDSLFSYHRESELFLQRMMSLYLSSHYKNSPNDLQLMADAPAHHLFVLLGPVDESKNHLPDILCVIQVCLEGQISQKSAEQSLSQGHQPSSGDQIPWKFCEQFNDTVFPTLFGARIVHIATHPNAMRLGYGSVAVQLLTRYYEGQLTTLSEAENESHTEKSPARVTEKVLLQEQIKPGKELPPLLLHLQERRPERLHYVGVSFGLKLEVFRFWRKNKFGPFYICHVTSAATGEHTCMVLKALKNDDIDTDQSDEWGFFSPFYHEYQERFMRLLQRDFRGMDYKLAMSIIDLEQERDVSFANENLSSLHSIMTPRDLLRLESYVNNHADYHSISELVFDIARQYFRGRFPVTLSYPQASVLFCLGLQRQDVSNVERQMMLERSEIFSLFTEVLQKLLIPQTANQGFIASDHASSSQAE